jgi:hypothetical protein
MITKYKLFESKRITLKGLINSKAAFNILDATEASMCDWQEGGCWILADAFSIYFNLPLYVVYNNTSKHVEHFIVHWSKYDYLDSDGFQSKETIINKVLKGIYPKIDDLEILEYKHEMETGDIVRDLKASNKLVELFKKYTII